MCFWVTSVVPSAAVSRHGRTPVIFHDTYNMAAATLVLGNGVIVTICIVGVKHSTVYRYAKVVLFRTVENQYIV